MIIFLLRSSSSSDILPVPNLPQRIVDAHLGESLFTYNFHSYLYSYKEGIESQINQTNGIWTPLVNTFRRLKNKNFENLHADVKKNKQSNNQTRDGIRKYSSSVHPLPEYTKIERRHRAPC